MTKWHVKELADLTGVSVQTLHYYDRINLLKPSLRSAAGYRVYSEKDLLILQQIVALKYFGFELSKIKQLISGSLASATHLRAQAEFLEQKAKKLAEASQTLQGILSKLNTDESIPWETIIKLIEVYHMTQALENSWAGKILNETELKQYAQFEQEKHEKFNKNPKAKSDFLNQKSRLLNLTKESLHTDPKSDISLDIAKQWMDMINGMYGPQNANLKQIVWEKGFKQGKIDDEKAIPQEIIVWLDIAIDTYYRKRMITILSPIKHVRDESPVKAWKDLMEEMCGHSIEMKKSIYEAIFADASTSNIAKDWLRNHFNLE